MEDVVPGEEANTLESAVLETLNSPQLHTVSLDSFPKNSFSNGLQKCASMQCA